MQFVMYIFPHPWFNPVGVSVLLTHVYTTCPVIFKVFQTWDDLVILDRNDFDSILGMTCPPIDVLNCYTNFVTLEIPHTQKLGWEEV